MTVMLPETQALKFGVPESWLGPLDANVAALLVAAAGDLVLCLDRDGVIRDIGAGGDETFSESCSAWIGQKWVDVVTPESRVKVEMMMADALVEAHPKWREINHTLADGQTFPVRYSVIKVDRDGRLVALGRDLRSVAKLQQRMMDVQRSMERDYAQLRNAETRYRLLFQLASEAVMIVDAASEKIIDANPVAGALLGSASGRVAGRLLRDLFNADSQNGVQGLLAATRSMGRSEETAVTLRDGATDLKISASLFRNENANHILVRLAMAHSEASALAVSQASIPVLDVIKGLPEGFVVMNTNNLILEVNKSFLEMAELASPEQARGKPLDTWLGRPGIDVKLLVSNLRDHGSLRDFATIVRGEFGSTEEVEVTAVAVSDGPQPCIGMVIRQVRRRPAAPQERGTAFAQSVEHLSELVGSVPLKDLVRETTDMIEQMCIEAALKLTDDNRASAAQILGLSRQSLYSKLRRYGLGDLDGQDD